MKLYSDESPEIIFQMQNRDPFFHYLSTKVEKIFRQFPSGKVLDLGCGSGRNCILAAKMGCTAVGVDIQKEVLEIGRRFAKKEGVEKQIRFIHADLLHFSVKEFGLFDVCVLQETIEHVEDYQRVVDLAYQSLKPGGVLLLSTPHDPAQWNRLDDYAEHVRRFTLSQISASLKKFEIMQISTVGFPFHRLFITLYDVLLRFSHQSHQARTFRKSSLFHQLYYWFGSFILMIDDFFTFLPFGTTILAIARKGSPVKERHE